MRRRDETGKVMWRPVCHVECLPAEFEYLRLAKAGTGLKWIDILYRGLGLVRNHKRPTKYIKRRK